MLWAGLHMFVLQVVSCGSCARVGAGFVSQRHARVSKVRELIRLLFAPQILYDTM